MLCGGILEWRRSHSFLIRHTVAYTKLQSSTHALTNKTTIIFSSDDADEVKRNAQHNPYVTTPFLYPIEHPYVVQSTRYRRIWRYAFHFENANGTKTTNERTKIIKITIVYSSTLTKALIEFRTTFEFRTPCYPVQRLMASVCLKRQNILTAFRWNFPKKFRQEILRAVIRYSRCRQIIMRLIFIFYEWIFS